MMKRVMKKLWEKKDSKKGFTLVELIVVLVILAILAAIMVPALLGWIDKAREQQAAVEARTVYLAAQTIASEKYAKATGTDTWETLWGAGNLTVNSAATDAAKEIYDLAALTSTTYTAVIGANDGVITGIEYNPNIANIEPIVIGVDPTP